MKILKIKEQKDGSAIIDYEITKEEEKVIKQITRVKKLTKKIINKFVLEAITKYLMEKK
jgi:hypothetical protein